MLPQQRTWLVDVAWTVTWLGDWLILVPVAIGSAGWLLWRKQKREAIALLITVAAVRGLVSLQKILVARPRPDAEPWMVEYSNGFPSAHAANSAVTFMAIAIFLSGSRRAIAAGAALTMVVGLSRVFLGVHWPTDVLGGWAFGLLAVLPLWKLRRARRQPRL